MTVLKFIESNQSNTLVKKSANSLADLLSCPLPDTHILSNVS